MRAPDKKTQHTSACGLEQKPMHCRRDARAQADALDHAKDESQCKHMRSQARWGRDRNNSHGGKCELGGSRCNPTQIPRKSTHDMN